MYSFRELNFAYHPQKQKKDNDRAGKFLKLANVHAERQNYYRSLEFCNMAICFAKESGMYLGLAYMERAKTLVKMRRYREALFNIQLAFLSNVPPEVYEDLVVLESECKTLKRNQIEEPPSYRLALSRQPHEAVPWRARCLENRRTENMGLGVFTTEDLNPADLVAIERPFVRFLLLQKRYVRCAYCLKEDYFTMVPCEMCTVTMYCSNRCRNKAEDSFHDIECPTIDALLRIFDKMNAGLHVVYSYFTTFPDIAAARNFFRNFPQTYPYEPKFSNLLSIEDLDTHVNDRRDFFEYFHYTNMARIQESYLRTYSPLGRELITVGDLMFFSDLIKHYVYSCPANAFDLVELNLETEEMELYGAAYYPFCSRLNHSCAPNATLIYRDANCFLFVTRPIKANEQLFISYGPHFLNDEKIVRQRILQTIYKFECKCEACEGNYPVYSQLRSTGSRTHNYFDLKPYSYSSVKNYTRYQRLLVSEYYTSFPCRELCTAEECLKIELNILANAFSQPTRKRLENDGTDKNPQKPTVKFAEEFIDDEDPFRKAFNQSYVRRFFQENRDRTNIFENPVVTEGLQDMSLFDLTIPLP